jgi:DNA-binding transcriptional MocR family regulator
MRSLVIGHVGSFKECWAFRKKLADKVGCSVRTVQRALTQARSEGLIGLARAKKTEVPPNWEHGPVTCGWSHRWVIGWGKAGEAARDAVHAAKARWFVKHALSSMPPKVAGAATEKPEGRTYKRRPMSAEELDAELMGAVDIARAAWERRQKPPPS